MRCLIDTHALIWAALDPSKLGALAATTINDASNERYFSAASTWEMAIKINIGKMVIPGGLSAFIAAASQQLLLKPLVVLPEHTIILESLPLHHTDPFDRLLVAQALYENLPIVSIDAKLDPYHVRRLW